MVRRPLPDGRMTDSRHIWSIPVIMAATFLAAVLSLGNIQTARAADFAMNCPPGWSVENGDQLLRRCVSPARDGFIEVYVYDGEAHDLSAYLDAKAGELAQRGMPFHQFRKEAPGNVSGIPALAREYSGTANNALFHSYIAATSHGGRTYMLQALYLAEHAERLQPLIREAMNSWSYPSVEQARNKPPQLPGLGAGRDTTTGSNPVPSGGRSFADRDDCINHMCKPFSAHCGDYNKKDPSQHFRYLLCKSAWDSCYYYCSTHWSLALTCAKEAIVAAQGYWISACTAVAHDSSAMNACFRRGDAKGTALLWEMRKRPECKASGN